MAAYNPIVERYRIHADAAVYYLTYSVVEWLPVFVSQASCQIVTESLSFCHRDKQLRVNAYVIMPTHLHMIVFDADWDSERLRRTLADLRKFTGRHLSDYCAGHAPRCFWRDPARPGGGGPGAPLLATEPSCGSDHRRTLLAAKDRLPARESVPHRFGA